MSHFGALLREWRTHRGMSQLSLAIDAGTSQRHLSFVESGRAKPGEELVLKLAELLGLTLRDRNALLFAAGYAPRFGEASWESDELALVRHAVRLILDGHSPHPALVLDVTSTILDANDAALTLLNATSAEFGKLNLIDLVFRDGPVRDAIVNWTEVATYLLGRLREAVRYRSPASRVHATYERAAKLAATSVPLDVGPSAPAPVLPLVFRVGDETTHWFTTVTTFGAPQDALVEEISIELFHPWTEPGRPR